MLTMQAASAGDILPFHYEGMRLRESCWMEGKPYFTRRAIGEFLEYRTPEQSITKIVERSPHIRQFATVAKLTTVEGRREVERDIEVYDPIGLQLIINKSNQPKAIAFQVAVAHLVVDYMQGRLKPSKWASDRISALKMILSLPPRISRGRVVADLAAKEGVQVRTVYRWLDRMGGLSTSKGVKRRTRADAGITRG